MSTAAIPPNQTSPATELKTGAEPILDSTGMEVGTTLGFWQWSSSNLLDNTRRGLLAEYLVGLALDCATDTGRREWDPYDLKTAEGTRIEVKSASYLQSWCQAKPSDIRFGIAETLGWDTATGTYSPVVGRWADVYVFCLFTEQNRQLANPLDTRQWRFFVAATRRITARLGQQKSIGLPTLRARVEPAEVGFEGLASAVSQATAENQA